MEYNKELEHRRDLVRLQKLRPIDDDFMRVMLKDNLPLAQLIVRIITGKSDLTLLTCKTQADMKRVTGARSICLDAYATDSAGRKYDIEIQRADKGAEPHRARYHASVMDVENLDKGQQFTELPDVYVIFITENDVFQTKQAIHVMRTVDQTTGLVFEDGRHILYVNGEFRDNSDIGRLMHDMNCHSASEMYFPLMAERTAYLKESQKGVSEMCAVLEEMRNECVAYGRAEGELKKAKDTAKSLYAIKMSISQIADIIKVPIQQVEAWLAEPSI